MVMMVSSELDREGVRVELRQQTRHPPFVQPFTDCFSPMSSVTPTYQETVSRETGTGNLFLLSMAVKSLRNLEKKKKDEGRSV